MQIFKTDKKIFWANELKSWLWTFAFIAFVYFVPSQFVSLTSDTISVGVTVVLLLKLSDTLTQFHLKEIQIDDQTNQLIFVLKSVISCEKIKQYEFGQASSKLAINSGLAKYLTSPFALKIFLRPKDIFRINDRYGFSLATLTEINNIINSKNKQAAA
jgi:hypothetical protein